MRTPRILLSCLALALSGAAQGAIVNVSVGGAAGFVFTPADVTVRVRWSILDPNYPDIFPGECVTDAAGTCAIEFTPPFSDAVEVQATIFQIEADPSVATVPGALNFIKP